MRCSPCFDNRSGRSLSTDYTALFSCHTPKISIAQNPFNEYEIIKLISLYDGRSENTGPYKPENTSAECKLANDIKFEYNSTTYSILELIEQLTVDQGNKQTDLAQPKLELKSGTIQILADEEVMEPLLTAVKARREDDKEAHLLIIQAMQDCRRKGKILRSLSGIAIGIFDFEETDVEEILDTFEPSFSDSSVFIKFNRCTLLSIAMTDRALEASKIGVSPYLIIPHAVIIHNEKLIEMAMAKITKAEEMVDKRDFYGCQALLTLNQIEKCYELANRYMHRWYLPMIFNYPTETTLFSQGHIKRGTIEKYKIAQTRLKELHSQIVSLWELRRGFGAAIIATLLTLISALQLIPILKDTLQWTTIISHTLIIVSVLSIIVLIVLVLSLLGLKFKNK